MVKSDMALAEMVIAVLVVKNSAELPLASLKCKVDIPNFKGIFPKFPKKVQNVPEKPQMQ